MPTWLILLMAINIPILIYLCVINFKILQIEIQIHSISGRLLEVSEKMERKL